MKKAYGMKFVKNIFLYSTLLMVAAFVIVLLCLGAYKLSFSAWQFTTFTKTSAVVISCDAKWSCSDGYNRSSRQCGFSHHPVAQVESGAIITGITGIPESQCSKLMNESVSVLVNPKNKSEGVIYTLVQFWLLPLFILLFFFMVGFIAITLFQNYRITNKALHFAGERNVSKK